MVYPVVRYQSKFCNLSSRTFTFLSSIRINNVEFLDDLVYSEQIKTSLIKFKQILKHLNRSDSTTPEICRVFMGQKVISLLCTYSDSFSSLGGFSSLNAKFTIVNCIKLHWQISYHLKHLQLLTSSRKEAFSAPPKHLLTTVIFLCWKSHYFTAQCVGRNFNLQFF